MGTRIKLLPTSVVSNLRSGTTISSVAQIAEELLCNSLDASASKIEIAVDGEAHRLKVVDDGSGISRDDLTLVGERHATSKLHTLDEFEGGVSTLGFRGEALSSLCDLALVEVTSRCRGSPNTYSKLLKGSTTVSIGLSGEQRGYGTTVSVRDIFYNQPVRRKLLSTSGKKTAQTVKECVLRFALIYPNVSFTVRDLARKEVLLNTKGGATMDKLLLDVFGEDVFGKLQKVDYAMGDLRLSGFISTAYHSHTSKALQYFYVNRRFVLKTAFHKLLNSWMGASTQPTRQATRDQQKGKIQEMAAGKQLSPMFVLNISCPTSEFDITFEPSKTLVEFKDWGSVISFARSVLQKVWGDPATTKIQNLERALNIPPRETLVGISNPGQMASIPPMSVRRALVQGDRNLPFECAEDEFPASACNQPGKKANMINRESKSSPIPALHELPISFEMASELVDFQLHQDNLQTDWDPARNHPGATQRNWKLSPCGFQRHSDKVLDPFMQMARDDFPDVHKLDWLSKSLSPESAESQFSFSGGPLFSLHNDDLTRFPPQRIDPLGSKVGGKERFSRNSSLHSLLPGAKEGSRSEAVIGTNSSPRAATKREKRRHWLEDDESSDATHFLPRMHRNDLAVSPVNAIEPEFGVDTRSCMLLPPARRELCFEDKELVESHRDDFETATPYLEGSGLPQKKKVRFMDSSDSNGLDDFSAGHFQFLHQNEESLDFEKTFESPCREAVSGRDISVDDSGSLDDRNDIDWMEIDFWTPKSEQSVYRSSGTSSVDQNGKESKLRHQKQGGPSLKVPLSREENCLRTFSGPPFYRPPHRYGAHANPFRSLSTTSGSEETSKYSKPSHGKADARMDEKRELSKLKSLRKTDCLRTLQKEGSSSAASASSDQHQRGCEQNEDQSPNAAQLCEHQRMVCGEAAERPVEARDMEQRTPIVDIVCASKHRLVNDVGSGMEGAELPMDTVKSMLKEWSNPCMRKDNDILDLSSGILASKNCFLLPGAITKDVLKRARVLRQVDAKFIASVSTGVLLLIDQHAADERVRLEELRESVLDESRRKNCSLLSGTQELFESLEFDRIRMEKMKTRERTRLGCFAHMCGSGQTDDPCITVVEVFVGFSNMIPMQNLTCTEQQALQTFREQIRNWGWHYKIVTDKRVESGTEGMCKVLVSSVPCILGASLTPADLTEYLQQLADTQGSSAPPPAVIRLLNYKACRGAIMFGDHLLPAECSQLVERLKGTSLCFQCAHGRPTMVPLLDLEGFRRWFDTTPGTPQNRNSRDRLKGAASREEVPPGNTWHGLRLDARPSVRRATSRLEAMGG